MNDYGFKERLAFSKGCAGSNDAETIQRLLPGCINVIQAHEDLDKTGVDFVAHLRRGSKVNIDVKRRDLGVSKYWTGEPELTLEQWSVVPSNTKQGVAGWTLDESKATDYILYVFHPADCRDAYLIPFQLLRMAFRRNNVTWRNAYRIGRCSTYGRYETESVFVPASVVIDHVAQEMQIVTGPQIAASIFDDDYYASATLGGDA